MYDFSVVSDDKFDRDRASDMCDLADDRFPSTISEYARLERT
jgi:hypothetical protein